MKALTWFILGFTILVMILSVKVIYGYDSDSNGISMTTENGQTLDVGFNVTANKDIKLIGCILKVNDVSPKIKIYNGSYGTSMVLLDSCNTNAYQCNLTSPIYLSRGESVYVLSSSDAAPRQIQSGAGSFPINHTLINWNAGAYFATHWYGVATGYSVASCWVEDNTQIPENKQYVVNITSFSGIPLSNSSINLSWVIDTNSTLINVSLFRNITLIYSGNYSYLNFSFLDTGLSVDTEYTYTLNASFNATGFHNVTISVRTNPNPTLNATTLDYLKEINSTTQQSREILLKIQEEIKMISLILFDALLVAFAIFLIRNKNYFLGLAMMIVTIGLDAFIARSYLLADAIPNLSTSWDGFFAYLFALSLIGYLFVKIVIPIYFLYKTTA